MNQLFQRFEGMKTAVKQVPENMAAIANRARKLGLLGVLQAIMADLFQGRTLFQWCYLLALSSVPIVLEFTNGAANHDWV